MPDYIVRISSKPAAADAEPVVTERIVRAANQARAIGRVVADSITVEIAETPEIIRLAKAGVELENAE